MSLIFDLIRTIAEAIEESRQPQQRPQSSPRPAVPPREDDALAEMRRRLLAERAQAQVRLVAPTPPPAPTLEAAHRTRVAARRAEDVADAKRASAAAYASTAARISRLVHQPQTLRDAVLLSEILQKPLALRPPRR